MATMRITSTTNQAESATISLVDRVFTRLGANDDIMAQKSTFFIELSETAKVRLHLALVAPVACAACVACVASVVALRSDVDVFLRVPRSFVRIRAFVDLLVC